MTRRPGEPETVSAADKACGPARGLDPLTSNICVHGPAGAPPWKVDRDKIASCDGAREGSPGMIVFKGGFCSILTDMAEYSHDAGHAVLLENRNQHLPGARSTEKM